MSKYRFGRKVFNLALTHGAGANASSAAATFNGLVHSVKIKTPTAVDGSATVDVKILDSDNDVIYSKTGLAANTTTIDKLTSDNRVALAGTQTVQAVFSANQTATDTTTAVTIVIDQG